MRAALLATALIAVLLTACGGDEEDLRPGTTVSDLGLPYATVPATYANQPPAVARVPPGAKDCGYEIDAPDVSSRPAAVECLRDAWEACEPAMLQFTHYTIGGGADRDGLSGQGGVVMRHRGQRGQPRPPRRAG